MTFGAVAEVAAPSDRRSTQRAVAVVRGGIVAGGLATSGVEGVAVVVGT